MPKVLVLFYSRTGSTAALADAVAEGARSVRFSEVDVRRIDDLAPQSVIDGLPAWKESRERLAAKYHTLGSIEELTRYDAVVVGSPTRYGVMAAELTSVLDQAGPFWEKGAFVNKVGSAFTSVSTPHGGHETTLWSMMTSLANLGMLLVPPADPATFQSGSPHGARASTAGGPPGELELTAARHQGKRVAEVVGWVTHAKSHHH